ncbi:MAG: hypothetical protein ACI83W_000963 [Marinoscillum sp.]|jgi:uncharacterized protein (DUF1684 family)
MKKLLYIVVPILIIVLIGYSLPDKTDPAYANKIGDIRAERVKYLKSSKQSPFVQFNKKYQPIQYFTVNPTFKVRANLERLDNPQRVTIQNSDGTSAQYSKFAYASFKLQDQTMKILILKQAGFGALPNAYFTAFADNTSGRETYGGGRYLDLDIGKSDNIEIDFNLAYNPYCAYIDEYSCPLPPAENILPLAIIAGEKDYKH